MRDGSDGVADWPILNALLNTASHADLVAVHGFGGQAQSAGATTIADGTAQAAERLGAVLTNDPGIGVLRHADAGYETAIATAARSRIGVLTWPSPRKTLSASTRPPRHSTTAGRCRPAGTPIRDVAELEHERIFARSWTLLCPEAKLASPGDHVVGNVGPRARGRHARRRRASCTASSTSAATARTRSR